MSFLDLQEELEAMELGLPYPPPEPLLPLRYKSPIAGPVRRGEIAGFLRAVRRTDDYSTDSPRQNWDCDCYCGCQVDRIPERMLIAARDLDPNDVNNWYICACGNELPEPPLSHRDEYELRMKLRCKNRFNLFHPERLDSPKYSHFRLAWIAATFPPHWRDGRDQIPKKLRYEVLQRDGHKCKLCGAAEDLTLDHIRPVSKGGPTLPHNLRILCRSCNSRKGAR